MRSALVLLFIPLLISTACSSRQASELGVGEQNVTPATHAPVPLLSVTATAAANPINLAEVPTMGLPLPEQNTFVATSLGPQLVVTHGHAMARLMHHPAGGVFHLTLASSSVAQPLVTTRTVFAETIDFHEIYEALSDVNAEQRDVFFATYAEQLNDIGVLYLPTPFAAEGKPMAEIPGKNLLAEGCHEPWVRGVALGLDGTQPFEGPLWAFKEGQRLVPLVNGNQMWFEGALNMSSFLGAPVVRSHPVHGGTQQVLGIVAGTSVKGNDTGVLVSRLDTAVQYFDHETHQLMPRLYPSPKELPKQRTVAEWLTQKRDCMALYRNPCVCYTGTNAAVVAHCKAENSSPPSF